MIAHKNQVILEKRIPEPLNLSLEFIRENEKVFEVIKRIARTHKDRTRFQPEIASQISSEYLENNIEEEVMINLEEVRNQFLATSDNLFNFIMNYDFLKTVDFDERVTIFCQITSQYERELRVEEDFQITNGVEFALVYPK